MIWLFFVQAWLSPDMADWVAKGQLISKCLFGVIVSTKIATKILKDFCPEIFCSFLGASWKLLWLPGDLVSNIINKEAYGKLRKASSKLQRSYKNFQGRSTYNIFVGFLV